MVGKGRILGALVWVVVCISVGAGTPLDDYVAAADENYRWRLVRTVEEKGYTAYIIDMISQKWRSKEEVNRTIWRHWLTIIRPEGAKGDTALLWIDGGSNERPAPAKADVMLATIAVATRSVVVDLRIVPNQPLIFSDDGNRRFEDAIIAYTFDKYIRTGDSTWPLLLPMVKSAVRAMDTVHQFMLSVGKGPSIEKFVVAGASKRGWTTWLTAAVDKRVVAIVPVVIDVLSIDDQMRHHYAAYGFYSHAIHDYEQMKLFDRLNNPEGEAERTKVQSLFSFVDPYEYRQRYTMPKFIVNSSGDQFFLLDSWQFYFDDLPGERYLRYVPNTDHGLGGSDADKSLLAFYQSILAGAERPRFSWRVREDGAIEVRTKSRPKQVRLWQAENAQARDFRLETIGRVWRSSPLKEQAPGFYVAKVAEPQKGWRAFFVELEFESGFGVPYKFTTGTKVVPDRLPFENKRGADAGRQLRFAGVGIGASAN